MNNSEASKEVSDREVIEKRLQDEYEKLEFMIPMRDGVKLYTVAYVPRDQSRPYPILMQRTPYSCKPYGPEGTVAMTRNKHLLDGGYILVRQDVRGRWKSEGEWDNMRPFLTDTTGGGIDEGTDTYDTDDWLLKELKNHNGRVGLYGISYPGFYTAAASIHAHPAVKAVSPQAPVSDFYFDDFHHRGAYTLGYWAVNPVFGFQSEPTEESWYTDKFPDPDNLDPYQFFLDHPTHASREAFKPKGDFFWEQIKAHPNYDAFWQQRSILPHLDDNNVAGLTAGGLFDAEDLYGPLNIYRTLGGKRGPKGQNTLVMGPWSHRNWAHYKDHQVVGDRYFGSDLSDGFKRHIEAPFFRNHLHEQGDYTPAEAYVYNTGVCRWDTFNQWPPGGLRLDTLFLASGGRLAEVTEPRATESTFVSDPNKPVSYRSSEDLEWRMTPGPICAKTGVLLPVDPMYSYTKPRCSRKT